jgi:uncharacterized membrane protein YjgN (DUF898 family)
MIELAKQNQDYQLDFLGKGSEYFSIMIINWLLTIVTLGIYYPWARANKLRYMYGQTTLNNERFHFSGTGREMFFGFLKLILFYAVIIAVQYLVADLAGMPIVALLIIYPIIFIIVPFAIHGSFRYKMSRTSYRGIRFGYQGNRTELTKGFFKWAILTIITLGIYSSWMHMNIRRYTHSKIRFGNVNFFNDCYGGDWFVIHLKGYFLSILTLGIYVFWWQAAIFNYYINNLSMDQGERTIRCYSSATGVKFFQLMIVNLLIIVFTLGFGKAWADIRSQKFVFDNIQMIGDIDINEIQQTQEEYHNAFGEDALDFFEIDLA